MINNMDNKILVIYVGVGDMNSSDKILDFINTIKQKIVPVTFEGEIIIIPTRSYDTRIECINPVYITDTELVNKHTELMKKLHEELNYQISQINNK